MSEPVLQPAPKKGMSTGAKIAIGCLIGVLLVIGACVAFVGVGGMWLKNKVTGMAERYESDPDAAAYDAALMAFKLNPDLEVVAQDDATKSITVRDKKDGKEVTFNLDDIKSGRLSIESGGETVDVGLTGGEGGEGGTLTVESEGGKMVFGGGDGSAVPDWIPAYPGARQDSFSNVEANGERSGTFTLHTSDSVDQVLAFFEEKLQGAGFEVQKATLNIPGAVSANLSARAGGRTVNVTVATQEGETQGLVAYAEKP
ncbi:MAG: hypothetical protein H6Q03_2421 [Acidobacteria bacterium]|jgi:hypothetical protein|nr:hypothetical protein [Acidobacteriota bacterium]